MTAQVANGRPLLEVHAVTVDFGGLRAVDDASFAANSGEITAVIGPNGAGKTTMLDVISGFRRPDGGTVEYAGHDITAVAPDIIARMGVARTFQNVEIVPELTTAENVLVACRRRPERRRARRGDDARRVHRVLDELGLVPYADELASELSYGVAKLIALARLIAADAPLLLLDEPGAGLPAGQVAEIGATLSRLVAERDKTVVLVDHNMELILGYADRVVVMHHGQVMATGTPAAIRDDPTVIEVYLGRAARRRAATTAAGDRSRHA